MKKLLIILFTALIMSCNEPPSSQKEISPVYIGGVVKNVKTGIVYLNKDLPFEVQKIDSAMLDSTGRFVMRLSVNDSDYYLLQAGNEYARLYLIPGDSLNIFADGLDFDRSLRFGGIGAEVNNYLAQKLVTRYAVQSDFAAMYSLEPASFTAQTDSVRKSMDEKLLTLAALQSPADSQFIEKEKSEILYWWAALREEYPNRHRYLTKNDSLDLPADFYSFRDLLSLNRADLLEIKSYNRYIQKRMNIEAEKEIEKDTVLMSQDNGFSVARFSVAKQLFTDEQTRNFILTTILEEQFMYSGVENTKEMYEEFNKLCTSEEYRNKIKAIRANWDKIAGGMPAPDFIATDIKGDTFTLDRFTGKYVYLDIWATWCGPCRQEIPVLEKLQEEFKKANVVFMSVSVDENKEAWVKMVTEKKMKGIQVYTENDWNSVLAKEYYVKSIPRFILIDKQGNIINANAPRPSGNIREVLKGLEGINS
ncbi:MAG: TlpA family protein disulfide reductase [Bacteroidetes bacterium]|nr:TlpA family protein disulfide reductase [Bacteroidota bacterium]